MKEDRWELRFLKLVLKSVSIAVLRANNKIEAVL